MRAPVSVIIPVLDGASVLPGCLAALMEGLEAGLIREVVVSDGGSEDGTRALAEAAGCVWVEGAPSRGGQLQRGVAAAAGEWLLVVHADTVLQPGWAGAVRAHLGRAEAGYFALRFDVSGFAASFVAGWANLRSAVFGLPYGDQGVLVSRELYDAVGGYVDQPLMEDVAIARALRGRLVRLDGVAVTRAERYVRAGWVRRGGRNLWTLLRYFAGVDVEELARRYKK